MSLLRFFLLLNPSNPTPSLPANNAQPEVKAATEHDVTNGQQGYEIKTFGASGTIVTHQRSCAKKKKALSPEQKRTRKMERAVTRALHKHAFGELKTDLEELATLREEQASNLDALARSMRHLDSNINGLIR